ncbi:hypothetical protein BXZ70DRAFT_928727 [Cristinia sonorae]|uniref:DNA recombination and repair protein Rad51-like C-terminal domain-containing protein n=1 Tax=Cristinia sonorae TaxID=1940300 RepID=A0A8K0UR53_9AGAR|nr:hypothetical protein BXZ70DRAFT_928727 [Cristinia sonorae]
MDPAAVTTDSLLAEIHSESLQSFLTSLRLDSPPTCKTAIPAVDNHAVSTNPLANGLRRGDIIELQGPPASGKSHLVYHLVINCILPPRHTHPNFTGWGRAAVVFDPDRTFDVTRLRQLLWTRISAQGQPEQASRPTEQYLQELLDQCMRRLHVIRPTSTVQLAFSILHLSKHHATHPSLQNEALGLIAVDSMNAFYWDDRYTMEQLRGAGAPLNQNSTFVPPLAHVCKALHRLRLSHAPVVVLTTRDLIPVPTSKVPVSEGTPVIPSSRQHLYPFLIPAVKPRQDPEPTDVIMGDASVSNVEEDKKPPLLPNHPPRRQEARLPLAFHLTLSQALRSDLATDNSEALGSKGPGTSVVIRGPTGFTVGSCTLRIGEDDVLISSTLARGEV